MLWLLQSSEDEGINAACLKFPFAWMFIERSKLEGDYQALHWSAPVRAGVWQGEQEGFAAASQWGAALGLYLSSLGGHLQNNVTIMSLAFCPRQCPAFVPSFLAFRATKGKGRRGSSSVIPNDLLELPHFYLCAWALSGNPGWPPWRRGWRGRTRNVSLEKQIAPISDNGRVHTRVWDPACCKPAFGILESL